MSERRMWLLILNGILVVFSLLLIHADVAPAGIVVLISSSFGFGVGIGAWAERTDPEQIDAQERP